MKLSDIYSNTFVCFCLVLCFCAYVCHICVVLSYLFQFRYNSEAKFHRAKPRAPINLQRLFPSTTRHWRNCGNPAKAIKEKS